MSRHCEITFESWIRCTKSELTGVRLAVSEAVCALRDVESVYLDIHPAESHGGYAHVAVRARQLDPLQMYQWGVLNSDLEQWLPGKVAVSKVSVWIPQGVPGREEILANAEQVIKDMGCEPRVWSDWEGEVKISQRPARRTAGP